MELRQLRYFVVVAEELNLQRASKRLGMCAPPLHVQMRKLQASLGVTLLRVHRRKLQLTEEGRCFLEEARSLLAAAEGSVARLREVAQGDSGRLTIGCSALAEFGTLPRVLAAFRQTRPHVQLVLRSLNTRQQLTQLAEGRIDVGLLCPPIPTDGFDVKELCRRSFVVAVPQGHPLSARASVSFDALSGTPLITLSRALDPHIFDEIKAEFRRAGARMEVAFEVQSSRSMLALVDAGTGCCIVPEDVRQVATLDRVVFKPLDCTQMERSLAIIKRSDRKGIAAMFWNFVTERDCRQSTGVRSLATQREVEALCAGESAPGIFERASTS